MTFPGEEEGRRPPARKPRWLLKPVPNPAGIRRIRGLLDELRLNTVCEDAGCPNRGQCWNDGTATFMILGSHCTRSCGFCKVLTGRPEALDPTEPLRVAQAVKRLGLQHAVITSVARDDLPDGGAEAFARTIEAIRALCPGTTIEVLIPDFKGSVEALARVMEAGPDVLNHNVETVPRLYRRVRPQAKFDRSLFILRKARELRPGVYTKSGLMVGLGEREEEVLEVMQALRGVECDFLTIGQYLQPSPDHLPVEEYITPAQFQRYRELGEALGFLYVASGPFVRSSFDAAAALRAAERLRLRQASGASGLPPASKGV
ncbi:lipoyl synthase [Limnochorda sp.]|uniref:lipoyl synthase n=1 Tax=Limnochorda sp. TaxID=1940279 RepID=UPI0018209B36|nr:lipoyl synthase [Bacillota bacterium]MBO2518529.1 lipoyl synthase [Bacillota bacterium]NMA70887.1 lipoyl synthase [Bacillota bacterium]